MLAPEPDHARLLDEFFGHEQSPRHLAGPGRLAGPSGEGWEGPADDRQRPATHQRVDRHLQSLYGPASSVHFSGEGRERRADDHQSAVIPVPDPIQHPPEPLYEQARRAAGLDNDWDLLFPASQGRRR